MSVDLYQLKEEEKQRCWVVFSRALATCNSAYIQTPSVGVKTDAQATSSAPSGTYSQSGAPRISNASYHGNRWTITGTAVWWIPSLDRSPRAPKRHLEDGHGCIPTPSSFCFEQEHRH